LKDYLVAFTGEGFNFGEYKLGELHEKHALALGTWEPSQHLLEDRGKPRKLRDMPRGPYRLLASYPANKRIKFNPV
jgi:hypothetical protein